MSDSSPSIHCTFEPRDAAAQVIDWADLRAHATAAGVIENGVRLTFPATMTEALDELVQREASCCSFLTFTVTMTGEDVVLEVESGDPNALPTISLISGVALS